MIERWEYKVIHLNARQWTSTGLPKNTNEHFDELGAQGWELVGTEAMQRASLLMLGSNTVGVIAYFKRRLHT
ncbi:MAG: hypothetical protein ACJAUC_002275 [Planctomycetota bacterium]|jgi:hypothetical protein